MQTSTLFNLQEAFDKQYIYIYDVGDHDLVGLIVYIF